MTTTPRAARHEILAAAKLNGWDAAQRNRAVVMSTKRTIFLDFSEHGDLEFARIGDWIVMSNGRARVLAELAR